MTARELRMGWLAGLILTAAIVIVAGIEGGAFALIGGAM